MPDGHVAYGLYIGVGEYEDPTVRPLKVHRTNQRVLVPLLADRFGVRWLDPVLDEHATREGIREGLLSLLDRAREAKASGRDVSIVLFYTGHGSQVRDQDGDESDGLDETLVTVRSSIEEGAEDIRDDDIAAFRLAVEQVGAELVMIIEACHSESVYRGPPAMTLTRRRVGPGPARPLFPELSEYYALLETRPGPISRFVDGSAGKAFVCFTASQDEQLALETVDGDGTEWGRFSLALARSLARLKRGATYRDLERELRREFESRWPDDPQRPMVHPGDAEGFITLDHRDAPVLAGGFPAPHARVIGALANSSLRLDMGVPHGFEPGALVRVYESLESLERGEAPILESVVVRAGLADSVLETPVRVPQSAVAQVASPAMTQTPIFVHPRIDEAMHRMIAERAEDAGIKLVDSLAAASFSLEPSGSGSFRILRASEAMSHEASDSASVIEWIHDLGTVPANADAALDSLAAIVRSRRFWAIEKDPELIGFDLLHADGTVLPPAADGAIRTAEVDNIGIRITNRSDRPLNATVFQSVEAVGVIPLFEQVAFGVIELGPGESWESQTTLRLAISQENRRAGVSQETSRLKILLTADPLDLRAALAHPSDAQRLGVRNPGPFATMFEGAMRRTRQGVGNESYWGCRNVLLVIRSGE